MKCFLNYLIFPLFFLTLLPFQGYSEKIEKRYKYDISICAIFQDEAPYLKEWIEYHRLIGVKHFWLYNNNSHDHYKDVLKPYIKNNIVELINWPSPETEDWTPYQVQAYNHCIQKCRGKTKWLAIIDLDEFIVPVKKKKLIEVLKEFDKYGGLMAFWQFYGTSDVPSIPNDKLMIECLTRKAWTHYNENAQVKSICRPERVTGYAVHGAYYKNGFLDVTENHISGPGQPISIEKIRINHYCTRDEEFFYGIKIPRRERCGDFRFYNEEAIRAQLEMLNQVEDRIIDKYVPQLRKRIFKKIN